MILIFSQLSEASTNLVMDWLEYLNADEVCRINQEDVITSATVRVDNQSSNLVSLMLRIRNTETKVVELSDIRAYWYRRGQLCLDRTELRTPEFNYYKQVKYLNAYINHEKETIEEFVIKEVEKQCADKLGSFFTRMVNKMEILTIAKECKLLIPETLITSKIGELNAFVKTHGKVIVKNISNSFNVVVDDISYIMYASLLDEKELDKVSRAFSYSLFQRYIPKKYELRTFFINGCCYTMAIFSQRNKQTEIDYRKYDWENPNRYVPYKLPKFMERRICDLMNKCGLDTGSIDLIYSTDQNYYFLEVNPVGQFGMVSIPCNYYLEREVAKLLSDYERR